MGFQAPDAPFDAPAMFHRIRSRLLVWAGAIVEEFTALVALVVLVVQRGPVLRGHHNAAGGIGTSGALVPNSRTAWLRT